MRLLVDLQSAQGDSRFRGIGRYALGLTKALATLLARDPDDELHVLVNESMVESATRLRQLLTGLVLAERVHGFRGIHPTLGNDPSNRGRRRLSEAIRETAIAVLQPDVLLVTSLFEGFGDRAVTSVKTFCPQVPTAVVLYDLIPLAMPDQYLRNPIFKDWYEEKLASLRCVDHLLAISEAAAGQATALLGAPEVAITTIGIGLDSHFIGPLSSEKETSSLGEYGITRRFILYAGGFDPRKNLDVLIEAFARLDPETRSRFQIVLVGRCVSGNLDRVNAVAGRSGLSADDLVFTGFVADAELVAFYRNCHLFVFPSELEGFGLPVLEALICGAPVLAVRSPTMSDIVADESRLIPPGVESMLEALDRVLKDPVELAALRELHPDAARRYRWESVAEKAVDAMREMVRRRAMTEARVDEPIDRVRPRLAVIAPLPPAPSGIADYCLELIPALASHYSIELVTNQEDVDRTWIPASMPIRSVTWFEEHGDEFSRILYHFGNSPFHRHMFGLLARFPGVVVLHDFFLSETLNWLHSQPGHAKVFDDAVAHSHGAAGQLMIHEAGRDIAIGKLPCNLAVLEAADCVIVHSEHAAQLAFRWFGSSIGRRHVALPFPRVLRQLPDRETARKQLGIGPDETLICSFGMIAPHKLIHIVVSAFSALPESSRARCRLVLVGANHPLAYGTAIRERLELAADVDMTITGHVSSEQYRAYLAAADIAVQLRGESRGETSAAVFDALGAGLALIVNDHASLGELPADVVERLSEDVTAIELRDALARLIENGEHRRLLGVAGRKLVAEAHDPAVVARRYAMTIESAVALSPRRNVERLERQAIEWSVADHQSSVHPATIALAVTEASHVPAKTRLFVDVTAIAETDLRTGIQRTVRALLLELLRNEPAGFRVELVRADRKRHVYRFADQYLDTLLERPVRRGREEVIDLHAGDVFLGLDLSGDTVVVMPEWFRKQHDRGVHTVFVVYDLLPVQMKECFPNGMDLAFNHWLQAISKAADEILCISEAVADDFLAWLDEHQPLRRRPLKVGFFHLGADLGASAPTRGFPPEAPLVSNAIRSRSSFLMVGTVEPRKGHVQVLDAFDLLWAEGNDVGLVIVGKLGWMMDDFLKRVSSHVEYGTRLFWLQRISDEFLESLYPICTALIAASRGEGFGLPLIEAAQHALPVIARDLKVFREVAGDHAFYFHGQSPEVLAESIVRWLDLKQRGLAPTSEGVHWSSWQESARQLSSCLRDEGTYRQWHFEDRMSYGERLMADSGKLDWEGWSPAEPTHRWSDGRLARIGFVAPTSQVPEGRIEALIGTFGVQELSIYLNGVRVYSEAGELAEHELRLQVPRDTLIAGEQNWIDFVLPLARSPSAGEARQLGLYLKFISVI